MPKGKPAGVPCIQLDPSLGCKLFDHPDRPAVCASLKPSLEMCGETREHALSFCKNWRHGQLAELMPVESAAKLTAGYDIHREGHSLLWLSVVSFSPVKTHQVSGL